jgi:oxygen-independent coproporphyrinogen-3 oxidase
VKKISVYIHYPFCISKCNYCDFNSYNFKIDDEVLIDAYKKELNFYGDLLNNSTIETIYFGGGTPSLMSEKLIVNILDILLKRASVNTEITIEANPNSLSFDKVKSFYLNGINRISIGVQSINDEVLKFLGRIHNRDDIIKSIRYAEKVFKDRYSIDLIYDRPRQTIKEWINELNESVKISPYHISAYQLIIEKGTFFSRHKIQTTDNDTSADLYNITNDILSQNGINFYEISNYAKSGYECKHNLIYWNSGEWLGIGAGAHGRININGKRVAFQNLKNPIRWVKKINEFGSGISVKKYLYDEEIREEKILMGLRTVYGINNYQDLKLNNLDLLLGEKFIEINKNNLKLTKRGFLLLNSVIEKIL